MKGPREPFLSGCYVCGKQYLGYAGDPCPSCGGDVDVAGFKRAVDPRDEIAQLRTRLAEVEKARDEYYIEIEALHAELGEPYQCGAVSRLYKRIAEVEKARDEACDLAAANIQWDGYSGDYQPVNAKRIAELRQAGNRK